MRAMWDENDKFILTIYEIINKASKTRSLGGLMKRRTVNLGTKEREREKGTIENGIEMLIIIIIIVRKK